MGVVHHVVADTAHDGTTHGAKTSSSHHNHWALLLHRDVRNHLTGLTAEHSFDLSSQL